MPVTGWKLDPADREKLLDRFPPLWPDVVAHHVTLDANAADGDPLPVEQEARVVGSVSDGAGLQALVVAIGDTTDRPDGSTYHITWSLDRGRGREAMESNEVIAERGWDALDDPVPIGLIPARL